MNYTTVSAVKLKMGITNNDSDALLNLLIGEATAAIDDYCRTTFGVTADSTRYFDAIEDVEDRTLYLDRHLAAITSVTNGDGVVIPPTDYVTKPANDAPYWALLLKYNSSLVWTYSDMPENSIAITGKWGYSVAVPVTITSAANALVEAAYNRVGKGGYSKLEVEDLAVTMAPILQEQSDLLTALGPYRRH